MAERIWDKYLDGEDRAAFDASGYGARAGFGERPALLVVDVNYNFCGDRREPLLQSINRWRASCGEAAWDALPVIGRLIDAARGKGVPVIYTTGSGRPDAWDRGSWLWKNGRGKEDVRPPAGQNRDGNDIMEEIAPAPQDIIVRKLKPSGFFGTNLAGFLFDLKADSVLVTGTTTSGCVRATVIDSFSYNLRTTIVEDACFDRSKVSHAINLCDMHAKYADVVGSEEVLAYIDGLEHGLFELPTGVAVR